MPYNCEITEYSRKDYAEEVWVEVEKEVTAEG